MKEEEECIMVQKFLTVEEGEEKNWDVDGTLPQRSKKRKFGGKTFKLYNICILYILSNQNLIKYFTISKKGLQFLWWRIKISKRWKLLIFCFLCITLDSYLLSLEDREWWTGSPRTATGRCVTGISRLAATVTSMRDLTINQEMVFQKDIQIWCARCERPHKLTFF